MTSNYVNYKQFDPAKLTIGTIDVKSIPEAKGQSYRSINLIYNYGTDDKPVFDQLLLEYPPVKSREGIRREETFNKISYSIGARFDGSPESTAFLDKLNLAYNVLAQQLMANRSQVGIPDLKKDNVLVYFKNPVYTPLDPQTGEPIPGRFPSCFLKLLHGSFSKTLFTDLDAKPIDWKLLDKVEMEYQPLVQWSHIYSGSGKIRLQQKVLSAIVTRAVAINTETLQLKTIEDIKEKQPDKLEQIRQQMAKLKTRTLDAPEEQLTEDTEDTISMINGTAKPYGFGKTGGSPVSLSFN